MRLTTGIGGQFSLPNVHYVPDLRANPVSGSQLIDSGLYRRLSDLECDFRYISELMAHASANLASSFSTHEMTTKKGLQPLQLTITTAIYHMAARETQPTGHGPKGSVTSARRTCGNFTEHRTGLTSLTHQTFATVLGKPGYATECTTSHLRTSSSSMILSLTKVILYDNKGLLKVTGHDGSRYFVTFEDAVNKISGVSLVKYKAERSCSFSEHFGPRVEDGEVSSYVCTVMAGKNTLDMPFS